MKAATLFVFDGDRTHLLLLTLPNASQRLLAARDATTWRIYLRGVQKIMAGR